MRTFLSVGGFAGSVLGLVLIAPAVLGMRPVSAQAPQSPTFHKDVLPILQKNCQSCHRPGQIGPMPLLTYQQTRPWAQSIKAKVASRQMPPWLADPRHGHFLNDTSLKTSEIDTLMAWADRGAPEGNPV